MAKNTKEPPIYARILVEYEMAKGRHYEIPESEVSYNKIDGLTEFKYHSVSKYGDKTYKTKTNMGHTFALTTFYDGGNCVLSRYKTDVEWDDEQPFVDMLKEKADRKAKREEAKKRKEERDRLAELEIENEQP